MKDREIPCMHYICEGECDIGREGTFRRYCQTCREYKEKRHGVPARPNDRKEKIYKEKGKID